MYVFTTTLHMQNVTQRQSLRKNLTGLNSNLSFSKTGCHTRFKDLSQCYYLPIAGERKKERERERQTDRDRERERERILGFIPFPRVLVLYMYIYKIHSPGFQN